MERTKQVERKYFDIEEKYYILSKSHGKCCHCGKKITVGDGFTIEHVIPISKGGTNDISNVVALCDECNKNKGNYVIFPYGYFKYLDDEFRNELLDNQLNYYETVNWFNMTNFLPEDKFEVKAQMIIPTLSSRRESMKNKNKKKDKDMYLQPNITVKCIASKAVYSDLDDIYKYSIKYGEKYDVKTTKEELKKTISKLFTKGTIYIIKNTSNEIVAVIPIVLFSMCVNDTPRCMIRIMNPMCIYPKQQYRSIVKDFLNTVFYYIFELKLELKDLYYRIITLECMKNDPISYGLFDSLGGNNYQAEYDEGDDNQLAGLIVLTQPGVTDEQINLVNMEDAIIATSDAILKKLNLKMKDIILGEKSLEEQEETK